MNKPAIKPLSKVHFRKGSDSFSIDQCIYNSLSAAVDGFDEIKVAVIQKDDEIKDAFGTVTRTIRRTFVTIYGIEADDDGRDVWMEALHSFTYMNAAQAQESARRWVHVIEEIPNIEGIEETTVTIMGFYMEDET